MIDNLRSDLPDRTEDGGSSFDASVQSSKPAQQPLEIRAERDVTVRSLVLGILVGSAMIAVCIAFWIAVIVAPIWGLYALLY